MYIQELCLLKVSSKPFPLYCYQGKSSTNFQNASKEEYHPMEVPLTILRPYHKTILLKFY